MSGETPNPLDLNAYFARIGYDGGSDASLETFHAVHLAHATQIPYENLDVLLGRPIRIDLESIQQKIVQNRRGGYCFEQNTLLTAALEQLGFTVTRLAARVRYYTTRLLPRTHMVMKVEAAGQSWLADVGFGGMGMLQPIPLIEGQEVLQHGWRLRLFREGPEWFLQTHHQNNWVTQYSFSLEPQLPVDYEPANHYCSTHPDSRFVQTLTAQRASLTKRHILKNLELITAYPDRLESRLLTSEKELLEVLADCFGLRFPSGTRFRPTMLDLPSGK